MNHHDGSAEVSRVQRAYDYVREGVTQGRWPPGTRLVTRRIAAAIGSSLNPVREALGRLERDGIVDHVPGAGAFVHRPDRRELLELFGVREAIETYAAAEATRLLSEDELDELGAVCDEWLAIARSLRRSPDGRADEAQSIRWLDLNEEFHRVLVDGARNRLLSKTITDYRVLATIFGEHRRLATTQTLASASRTWHQHARLVRSLRRRDTAAVVDEIRALIRSGRRNTLASLDRERARSSSPPTPTTQLEETRP